MSADSLVGLWSFDMSQGSFPPADHGNLNSEMFAPPTGVVTPSSVNQFFSSSGPPVAMKLEAALAMTGLSKEQAEEIFLLTCKAQMLGRRLTCNFIHLFHKEALFRMGIQATGYEKATSGCSDHVTAYYTMIQSEGEGTSGEELDKAIDHLWQEAGEAWLDTNSILFHHALKYQNKMSDFLMESDEAIEVLCDHIWMVAMKVMEDAGKSMADGLRIAMCLVDMLPIIPLHLAFHLFTPGLTIFAPEVYAAQPKSRTDILDFSHAPPPQSNWKALYVLCEEIVKNVCGATEDKGLTPHGRCPCPMCLALV